MDSQLLALAERRLRDGTLPAVRDFKTFGGPGSGRPCRLCEQPISRQEIELEIEWREQNVPCQMMLHYRCQAAWLHAVHVQAQQEPSQSNGEPA